MLMVRSLQWTERLRILLDAAQGDGQYWIYFNLYICHINNTILWYVCCYILPTMLCNML